MTTAVVIQARTASSRLPGKVLLPVAGEPLLLRMIDRVASARTIDHIVVATTHAPADDRIARLAMRLGVDVVRGDATDLIDRHLLAARSVGADAVVKLPAHSPLIDGPTIDAVVSAFDPSVDLVSNLDPPTWPDGFGVEVINIAALELAHREALLPHEREHTTPYIRGDPERFRLRQVTCETGVDVSQVYRLILEYPEDYCVIRLIFDELWSPRRHFELPEIIGLLKAIPELARYNERHIARSRCFDPLDDGELRVPERARAPRWMQGRDAR